MKIKTNPTMGDPLAEFAREIALLSSLADRVSARIEAGALSGSQLVGVMSWWSSSHHAFRRQRAALAKLRASLASTAGIEP